MKTLRPILITSIVMLITFAVTAQQRENFRYISPVPGSEFINPENNIALRHGDILDVASIRNNVFSVQGSERGTINGEARLSVDKRTLLFIPELPFSLNETITVEVSSGIRTVSGKELAGTSFDFTVRAYDNYPLLIEYYQDDEEQMISSTNWYQQSETGSTGSLDGNRATEDYPEGFPVPTIAEYDNPSPGYIFLGPRPMGAAPYDTYLLIVDNYGTPVYYQNWPRRTNDFKTLVNNQLTFCDFDNSNPEINKYLVMDSKFNLTDTLVMGNGYVLDQHDILMRENGNHFLMAYDPQLVDMSQIVEGGDTNATVIGFVVQELDKDHNVIFQWRSWDHFDILDANNTDFTSDRIDYVHGNAFEIDTDGNMLMSLRNMEEITKIDLNTGDIIWRLGLLAKNNMFTFTNDETGFSWQHDIRRLPNGNITVYDNGNYHTPKFSQALEYTLDEVNYTAELAWNYIHDPVVYGRATGAHRKLANGNAFICWGLTWPINVSEVDMDKSLRWELNWPNNVWEYRAFKLDFVSDFFETSADTLDYGEYDDYVPWPKIFTITNNSDEDMQITSTHNHWESYSVVTPLPLDIPSGETKQITVNFFPTMQGQIDDVLTLNYESMAYDTLPRRISRQVFLTGYVADEVPPQTEITPADGTENVPQDSQVIIEFDEPVRMADGSNVKVSNLSEILNFTEVEGEDVAYTAVIDMWKTKITLTPDTLKPLTDYKVEILANSIADKAGNVVADAQVSIFKTEEDQGIDEKILDQISIFPNPTNGMIYLDTWEYTAKYVKVIDLNGKTIFNIDNNSGNTISFDLSRYPAGIYFVEILLEDVQEPVSLKIIKN